MPVKYAITLIIVVTLTEHEMLIGVFRMYAERK